MNLYLLERRDRVSYDEFDSIVVAAPNRKAARATPPSSGHWADNCSCYEDVCICGCDDGVRLSVTCIGRTDLPAGVVHESFCAG
ncbi:hypothetical protein MLDJOKPK_00171 [Salmonella phage SPAsTU]|nr:hypothetical protein MLDJOKPK_00171 [Salmonella phage SPAsTU]